MTRDERFTIAMRFEVRGWTHCATAELEIAWIEKKLNDAVEEAELLRGQMETQWPTVKKP